MKNDDSKDNKKTETSLLNFLIKMIETMTSTVEAIISHITKVNTLLTSFEKRFNSFGKVVQDNLMKILQE